MSYQEELSQWMETVSTHLAHLSRPQAAVLATWSYALIFLHRCGLSRTSLWLALTLGGKPGAWRQRLREWCYDAPDKKGSQRRDLQVDQCFAPLLRWVFSWWKAEDHRVVLVLDSSTLADRFMILAISVAYRGRAIPVAWHLRSAGQPGAWQTEWLRLLASLDGVIPPDWTVLVMADRGLYARWLYLAIQQQGWHPFLRLKEQGMCRRIGEDHYVPLSSLLLHADSWSGKVRCFLQVHTRLECSLLAVRNSGYTEAWFIVTDLEPDHACAAWYRMRFWIEPSFKEGKRGLWQWQHSKMIHPNRAERLCLVMTVATLWLMSMAGQVDNALPASNVDALPLTHVARQRAKGARRHPELSCVTMGLLWLLHTLMNGGLPPNGTFVPAAWPETFPLPRHDSAARPKRKHPKAEKRRWEQKTWARRKAARKNLPV